jgi:hypothetical protein
LRVRAKLIRSGVIGCGYQVFGRDYQAGPRGNAHLAGMATAAHSSGSSAKLYNTLAEAIRATSARNARSPHRTRGFWVAVTAEGGGFTVRWVGRPPLPPPREGDAALAPVMC